MRFLVEAYLPTETGNVSVLDGTLMKKIQGAVQNLKPESVYFTVKEGQRTMLAVCNIPSEDQFPALLEPLWLDFKADIRVYPVMNTSDLEKSAPQLQKFTTGRK